MAIKIRLRRMGNTNRPFFRLIVSDSRSPRDGRFLEELGYYDPLKHPAALDVREERTLYWLRQGAAVSETARSLLKKTGVLQKHQEWKSARKLAAQTEAASPAQPAGERTAAEVIAAEAEALRNSAASAGEEA